MKAGQRALLDLLRWVEYAVGPRTVQLAERIKRRRTKRRAGRPKKPEATLIETIKGLVIDQCIVTCRSAGQSIPQMAEGMVYRVGPHKYRVGLSERAINRRLKEIAARKRLRKVEQRERVMAYLEARKSRQ